jgi:hypothetical protein
MGLAVWREPNDLIFADAESDGFGCDPSQRVSQCCNELTLAAPIAISYSWGGSVAVATLRKPALAVSQQQRVQNARQSGDQQSPWLAHLQIRCRW